MPGPDCDKLASVAARFSYFQEKKSSLPSPNKIDLRRSINPPARYKHARPTVRLRPRQVLCSKCRSICNENSENVDSSNSKKRKLEAAEPPPAVRRSDRRCNQPPQKNQRTLLPECRRENNVGQAAGATEKTQPSADSVDSSTKPSESLMAPKISARLQPNEIDDAMQSTGETSYLFTKKHTHSFLTSKFHKN